MLGIRQGLQVRLVGGDRPAQYTAPLATKLAGDRQSRYSLDILRHLSRQAAWPFWP